MFQAFVIIPLRSHKGPQETPWIEHGSFQHDRDDHKARIFWWQNPWHRSFIWEQCSTNAAPGRPRAKVNHATEEHQRVIKERRWLCAKNGHMTPTKSKTITNTIKHLLSLWKGSQHVCSSCQRQFLLCSQQTHVQTRSCSHTNSKACMSNFIQLFVKQPAEQAGYSTNMVSRWSRLIEAKMIKQCQGPDC